MKTDFIDKRGFLSAVKSLARSNNIAPQIMLQEVILDDLIDRIAHSKYNNNLIIKGGFFIHTKDIITSSSSLVCFSLYLNHQVKLKFINMICDT